MKKTKTKISVTGLVAILLFVPFCMFGQQKKTANIAVIQTSGLPRQDTFIDTYNPAKVRPQMVAHFNKLLDLFERAGEMGADLVCGPEDMQHIGAYGLHIDEKDPETGKILFNALAVIVPGPLTDQLARIAKKYNMYIIAPIYEAVDDDIFNTAVIFDRKDKIIGKHHKTVLPVMEKWLVSTGDEYEVCNTDFATIAIASCWKISYPEISSIYALKGADIIFNPTMARDNEPGERLSTAPMLDKGMAKMLFDAMRAVDILVSLEGFDSNRIGAIGHSLGAKEAFYLGAFDDRVKVIVSNEGGIGIDFSNWDDSWYLSKHIHNFNNENHELLALCAPKPFLLIGGDFADGNISIHYIEAATPVYSLYGKQKNISCLIMGRDIC